MRAKTINEFHRGIDPRQAMGSSEGVVLMETYNEIMKAAVEKWQKFITRNLVGRYISGELKKYVNIRGASGSDHGFWESINTKVKVVEIQDWDKDGDISFMDSVGDQYTIDINKPLWIS